MNGINFNPDFIIRMKFIFKRFLFGKFKKHDNEFKILYFFIRDYKWDLFSLLLLSIVLGVLETFQIVLLYPILDASFNLQEQETILFDPVYNFVQNIINLPVIVEFSLIFIIVVFLTFLVTLIYKYLSLRFTTKVILQIKSEIFDKLINTDYQYFVDTRRGDLLHAIITAPIRIRSFLETVTLIFSDVIVILIILITIFLISPSGVVIMLLGGILFILILRIIGKRVAYHLGKLQMKSVQSENEIIGEYIQGLRQIRSVYGELYWKEKYSIALRNYWDKYISFSLFKTIPGATLQFFFFSAIAILVIVFYYLYLDQFMYVIPVIGIFAFSALKILPRFSNMSTQYMTAMDDYPNLERVHSFLNDTRYTTIRNGTRLFDTLTSNIIFKDVDFSYHNCQETIKGLNLIIKWKKMTALVGHSGSGKSTVVSLLLRYYDVNNGSIQINGFDLCEYDLKSILKKVGYVSQDTFIYNATIRENISFGRNYSEEKIIEAAKKANIHHHIISLEEGYDSIVGDQGLKLSGGEKQRIAIARALVRDPEILILDEATSSLDNESEAIVQDSINRISENITTLIVAHRLSTIRKADLIYVMNQGEIIEYGNHNELMEKRGIYYELYESAD